MIQVENTPNPDSLKFLSEFKISAVGTEEFQKKDIDTQDNMFIKNLLQINGVELILLSENFITVKKEQRVDWDTLKPIIISYLNDYFQNHKEPILSKQLNSEEKSNTIDADDIEERIKQILDKKIRPAVARDGGDIKFKSFSKGIVKVELQGSCSGCPSSLMTLKQGVQNLLKHYIKEVQSVEAV
tara:strand:- start:631 stop:1185 length:555 start_codon:yes stop_codon:yes gene_type:complete